MSGHHPIHRGLQSHSVGDIYPLAVTAYGTADKVVYCVENLCTGNIAGFVSGNGTFYRREWAYASGAADFAERIKPGSNCPVDYVSDLVWRPFRDARTQQENEPALPPEELAAVSFVTGEPPLAVPCAPPPGRWNWYGEGEEPVSELGQRLRALCADPDPLTTARSKVINAACRSTDVRLLNGVAALL